MKDILQIKNLSKNYYSKEKEVMAIKHINLTIKEGEFIAIVGPSGCGKSTLLSILSELEKKSTGTILFPIKNKNKIGYMLQQDTLFPWLTIYDNCLIGLKIKQELTKENIHNVDALLDTYGLKEFKKSYPKSLSGGMKQRVALIRTLAIKPDILLLDEPFSALDYQTRLKVSDDVYRIIKKEQKTTIMVTHDLSEAISMANRVVVLSQRPATIKKIYEINLTNAKNPIENRKCKEFAEYYDQIWKEIDYHE